jgi:uncharacterized membrane protein YccC
MRPAPELLRTRGADRVLAVLIGAAAGAGLAVLDPAGVIIAAAVLIALAALAGTHGSRRYVTPAFTTFVVFLLLLVGSPDDTGSRFLERMAETVLGVALAVVFGVLVPALLARRGATSPDRGDDRATPGLP